MITVLLVSILVPMIFETRLARRHDRVLRAMGAREPPGDVYFLMRLAYPTCFLAMAGEGWLRGAGFDRTFATGAVIFALSKALKYWAIATLGTRWTFRVLVPPGSSRIAAGPYAVLRHPNYAAVSGELAGVALMAHAPVSGALSIVCFGALMAARIRVEEKALVIEGTGHGT
jgi:methyltransferase